MAIKVLIAFAAFAACVSAAATDEKIVELASVSKDDAKELERLLLAGANANAKREDGWSALMIASFAGHNKAAQALLRNGANADHRDKDGISCLMYAAYGGHKKIVEWLIEGGADVLVSVDPGGGHHHASAKILASEQGHTEIVTILERAEYYALHPEELEAQKHEEL